MDRRSFLLNAVAVSAATGLGAAVAKAERYFPVKADQTLYTTINRVKDPRNATPLEKKHAPVITAPATVKAGEPFSVDVAVGELVHDMGPPHWIQYIELMIGNEPAGRVDFQPRGFLRARATFQVVIPKEAAPQGKISLVAAERCNLHGYWESTLDVIVS